ncbi:MAG: hypothetical protein AB7G17_14355 [Phycisphaerales bacterium]
MNTDEKILAGTVLRDFVRTLGYEPAEVSSLVATPFDLTVSGWRHSEGRVALHDGHPVEWSESFAIDWSANS